MVINHNIPALQSYNIVNNTSNQLQKAIAKLSSGLRINSAADDAAGLAISEKMRAQVRGLDKAVSNAEDGISLIQTAEGALSETHSMLQRMRELSVQAANDTLTQQDRSYIQVEIDQLRDEVTRVGNTTQFNKKKLLNGDSAALWSSDNLETKAIINGGLREVDQFGQKKSIEGNYKISIKADPGQGEVQKSDIMKVKHENVLMNKSTSIKDGVVDVSVNNTPAGSYTLKYKSAAENPGTAQLTGSYGVGGTKNETKSTIKFNDVTSPVTKISVQTSDGTEIWSTTGSDLFKSDGKKVDAADQAVFFGGGTMTSGGKAVFNGVSDEIKAAARSKGITITDFPENQNATIDITATTMNSGEAPTLKIVYESVGEAPSPETTAIEVNGGGDPTQVKADGDVFTLDATDALENASVLFEVQSVDINNETVTLKATASKLSQSGENSTVTQDNIVVKKGKEVNLGTLFGGTSDAPSVKIGLNDVAAVDAGAKFVYSVTAKKADTNSDEIAIQIDGSLDSTWEDKWDNGPYQGNTLEYLLDGSQTGSKEIHFKNFNLNEKTGVASEGDIILKTNSDFTKTGNSKNIGGGKLTDDTEVLASFDAAYIGKVAKGDVKLRDLDKFWDGQGVFMLEDPKTITLNQGDGKTASVTLYANDTLDDVAKKLNDAVATGLGQAKYVDDATKFVNYVDGSTKSSEAVEGTFLIRSAVPGKGGEITLSGDEDLINAFSLNTIQSSKETSYSVDVSDAHTGEVIAKSVQVTGNVLHGVINPNVDVEFSALSGVEATWNDNTKKFDYVSTTEDTTLHLSDNTTVFQIGANQGEDMGINIGDMRSHALGLDSVNVMSRERASRSITIIDNAIDKVSTQRAKIGAYQNRLEYTVNNLTTASENLTSAESRIRDADMAKEMMNFTKLNIMLQAGNSMLAQANQQPQNVLSLIR
ncbi:MAG: flagellin [Synergistaceae bacterium]|nr:flagellin [Synergistaceae bacterium]